MSMRIYKVTTPQGNRLVEASTKSQAINHCVATDYSAEPISSSDLYAAISQGAVVEKVTPAKKPEGQQQATPPTTAGATLPSSASTPSAISSPIPSSASTVAPAPSGTTQLRQDTEAPIAQPETAATAPTASVAPAADTPAFLQRGAAIQGEQKAWTPPAAATAPAVHPVLAEQQRINPQAAAAAGAPVRAIIKPVEGGAQ